MGYEGEGSSILDRVTLGDFIGMILNKGFYQKPDDALPELYAGFVTSITDRIVGISTTHPLNKYHGKNAFDDKKQKQQITEIQADQHIDKYFTLDRRPYESYQRSLNVEEMNIGDVVMLSLDGNFFSTAPPRNQQEGSPSEGHSGYEHFLGFITLIEPGLIGISTTHHKNKYHGYFSGQKEDQQRIITRVGLGHVLEYKKFDILKEQE